MENKLYKKKIIWNGDSICQGSKHTGSWATRIADNCGAQCINYAIGGGTVAEGLPKMQSGAARHSVSATLDKMYEEHPDADYVIFDGGTNDADLLGNVFDMDKTNRLGSFEPYNYDGNYDVTTFCGALESVFYRATKYWTGKKIGFIVAQKMGTNRRVFSNRRFYFDEAVEGRTIMTRGANYIAGAVIGEGVVPVRQCLKILKRVNYDGYVSVEYEGKEDCIAGIERGLANLKRFISEI